jgi:hypothetical protein
VKTGFEAGDRLERYQDVKVGDVIEAFSTENRRRSVGVSVFLVPPTPSSI